MSLFIDIIVILAFALSFFSGIRKGFVRTVMLAVVAVISVVGAVQFTPEFSTYLSDKYIEKPVIAFAENSVKDLLSDGVNVDTLIEKKPSAFLKLLERFNASHQEVGEEVSGMETTATQDDKIHKIAEYIGKPLAEKLSKAAAFILLFIVLFVVLLIIALIISLIVKLPVLRAADKLLGGILGLISGALIAWGLSLAICHLLPHLAVIYENVISDSVIENSIIVKNLGSFDPMNLFK